MTYHASEIKIRLKRKVSRSGRISGLFDFCGLKKSKFTLQGTKNPRVWNSRRGMFITFKLWPFLSFIE